MPSRGPQGGGALGAMDEEVVVLPPGDGQRQALLQPQDCELFHDGATGHWYGTVTAQDKAILNYLLYGEGGEPDAETILYQPMDVDYASGSMVYTISEQDMEAYYEDYILEYKFKSTTWYDFLYENFAQGVEDRVALNARVAAIDYSGEQVKLTTDEGVEYFADKVISTVSVGVLRSNGIVFEPPMPEEKWGAIQDVEFLPGFKLFLKFSEQFYPDVISVETPSGEKTFYDVAYGKESENHILGLLSTGSSA